MKSALVNYHLIAGSSLLFPAFIPYKRNSRGRKGGGSWLESKFHCIQYEWWTPESTCSPCMNTGCNFKYNTGHESNCNKAELVTFGMVTALLMNSEHSNANYS